MLENTPNKRSLWDATAEAFPNSGKFQSDLTVDVLLIGAGITGVTAALTLIEQGSNVALVEAAEPGSGATGKSAGFIVPAFSKVSPGQVIKQNGEMGERLVRFVAESADLVFSLIQDQQIQCDAQQNGWFQPAKSEWAFEQIQDNAKVWGAFGAEGSLHDAETTQRLTGTKGYAGCWQAHSGGTLHPVKLVHGLLSRAIDKGLHFLSGTEALAISQNGTTRKVKTSNGDIHADTVLVCSNAQSPQLSSSLYQSIVPLQVCQIATQSIPQNLRNKYLQQGQCLTDTQVNLFSYRFDKEWRIISGALPLFSFGDGRRIAKRITQRLKQDLSLSFTPKAEHIWSGTASVTPDYLPQLFELGSGVYAISACNGRGLAVSTALGQTVARTILTRSFSDLPIVFHQPKHVTARSLKVLGTRLYPLYGMIRDFLKT